jgi:hypothetical protein
MRSPENCFRAFAERRAQCRSDNSASQQGGDEAHRGDDEMHPVRMSGFGREAPSGVVVERNPRHAFAIRPCQSAVRRRAVCRCPVHDKLARLLQALTGHSTFQILPGGLPDVASSCVMARP